MIPGVVAARRAAGGGGGDPYWPYVVSQTNWLGSNGSTTLVDDTGKTWTAYGNAQIDTTYGQSLLLDGAGDYATTPYHGDFALGSGLFCEEGFFRESVRGAVRQIVGQHTAPVIADCSFLLLSDNGYLTFQAFSSGGYSTAQNPAQHALNTIHHYACVRDTGDVFRLYLNGVQVASFTRSGSLYSSSQPLTVGSVMDGGAPHPAGLYFNGRVLARRLIKGACPYPAGTTFTPPAAPFPNS